jgi:DNA-binding Xre family transcriptional regulator
MIKVSKKVDIKDYPKVFKFVKWMASLQKNIIELSNATGINFNTLNNILYKNRTVIHKKTFEQLLKATKKTEEIQDCSNNKQIQKDGYARSFSITEVLLLAGRLVSENRMNSFEVDFEPVVTCDEKGFKNKVDLREYTDMISFFKWLKKNKISLQYLKSISGLSINTLRNLIEFDRYFVHKGTFPRVLEFFSLAEDFYSGKLSPKKVRLEHHPEIYSMISNFPGTDQEKASFFGVSSNVIRRISRKEAEAIFYSTFEKIKNKEEEIKKIA